MSSIWNVHRYLSNLQDFDSLFQMINGFKSSVENHELVKMVRTGLEANQKLEP